jgi:hypothetical protein
VTHNPVMQDCPDALPQCKPRTQPAIKNEWNENGVRQHCRTNFSRCCSSSSSSSYGTLDLLL